MPKIHDHDIERKSPGERPVDGDWDSLISNPDLREAFNAAREDGFDTDEAHVWSQVAVFGEEWAREKFDDDAVDAVQKRVSGVESGPVLKEAPQDFDYESADEALLAAHEKAVQWKAGQHIDEFDVSKAPGIWESRDEVPDWVMAALERLIRAGNVVWSGGYQRLPPGAEATVQDILEEKLTQPQGWSLDSLLDELSDAYPDHSDDYLLNILRNETSAVLNTAREEAYEAAEGPDEQYAFDWIGPNDHRTTDTCLAIEERIEDEGGAVTMARLKEILYEAALAHADAEGTPERIDDWQPHYQCRRTFVRRVQSI